MQLETQKRKDIRLQVIFGMEELFTIPHSLRKISTTGSYGDLTQDKYKECKTSKS